jgi:nucleotide-binding universal stress UspA family protein
MYYKVAVPLDGSKVAECVLSHVEALAKGCQVKEIIFLRAVEPFSGPSNPEFRLTARQMAEINASMRSEAEDYLKSLVSRLQGSMDGVQVRWEVLTGKAADSIAKYCGDNKADLVVIATHGRTGISHWVYGSVADRLLRSLCLPIFMVRAPGCFAGI